MGFTDVLKKVFPYLATAASLGGPLGTMAASAVGKAIGADKTPTADSLPDLLTNALGNPEQRLALQKAEQDFQIQMQQIGFKDAETLEQIAADDRDSARKREIAVRDYTPEAGFYVLTAVFTYMVHYLFKYPIPQENRAIVYTMAGSIGTLLVTAATYFYGTTRGSENKSTALATMANSAVQAKKIMLNVRQVEATDKPLLMAAAEADPYHKAAGLTGEHWLGRDSIFYEDEQGPVVALKTRNVVRVDIQFLTQDHLRNAKALGEGFARYVQIMASRHVTEIIFNTESPEVAHFFQKRFRFREVSKGTYSLYLG